MGFSLFGKNKQSASDTDTDELEGKAPPRRRRKSAEQPVDPVLPEKKRARRRLVGAAAMVLAAIIGLPMLLESEPQPLADDVQIYIPSIDKPQADAKLAQSEQKSAIADAPEAPEPQDQAKAAAPAIAALSPAPAPAPAANAAPAVKTDKPTAASAPPAPTSKPDTSKTTRSASSTENERAAQVQALLEGKNAPVVTPVKTSPEATKQGKFALQVAALESAENAKELQGKLSKAGIASYTEKVKVSGVEQIRVRVGPFASREEADRMRSKLSGMGLNGMVMPL